MVLLYFITDKKDLNIFFGLIFIAFLITNEILRNYVTSQFKNRMKMLIIFTLIIFIIIISKDIIY